MAKTARTGSRGSRRKPPRRLPSLRVPPSQETQDRILDAAEKLFAERGIDAVSTRSILAAAGVNVSLAQYHFGGRDGLIEALLRRRFGPITEERLRRLAEVEAHGKDATLEDVLRAFHEYPPPEWFEERPDFFQLLGQLQFSPNPRVVEIARRAMRDGYAHLAAAIGKRLSPGISPARLTARLYFVTGIGAFAAMAYGEMVRSALKHFGPGAVISGRTVTDEIVRFCAAGLRASVREEKP